MYRVRVLLMGLAMILINQMASSQMKLGDRPYTVQRSAILDMESDNQGLLLARLADTISINTLSPPDGMVIYFIPTKQLMVRSDNIWKAITAGPIDTSNISNFYLKVRGLLSAGTGISYNNTTGVITNSGVTSVGSGYGLTGGSITTTGTLLVDSATLSGYYMRRKDSSVNGGYYPYATNPKGYLTGNQTITLSGDVTGSGATAITTTLANSGVTAGTYNGSYTVDSKGRITTANNTSFNTAPGRSLNTNFTISTTLNARVNYTINFAYALVLSTSNGVVYLEYSTNGGSNWATVSSVSSVFSGTISISGNMDCNLSGEIPANALVRIRVVSNTNVTVTLTNRQQEVTY